MINIDTIVEAGDPGYNNAMFSWEVIDVCQYKCNYCSAMNFNLNKLLQKKGAINSWKSVVRMLTLKTMSVPYTVELLGGEPTLHPNIKDIITSLSEHNMCGRIDLITNLGKSLKFLQELATDKLVYNSSYHPAYSGDTFTDKLIQLNKEHRAYCNVNLSDKQEHWEDTKRTLHRLQENDITFFVNFLFEVATGPVGGFKPNYTDDFFEYFSEFVSSSDLLRAPCRLGEKGAISSDDNDKIQSHLHKHSHIWSSHTNSNASYITDTGVKYYPTSREIIEHDLAQFKGWNCNAMMYGITMEGRIFNHCTNETVTPLNFSRSLKSCVTCPLDRCDCETKFLYHKTRNAKK